MRSAARAAAACLLARRGAPRFQQAPRACSAELHLGGLARAELEEIYDGAFRAFTLGATEFSPLPDGEVDLIDGASFPEGAVGFCRPSTYLSLPVDDVLAHPEFRAAAGSPAKVLDLGAGIGRPILRAALLHGADSAGVELSETRWRAGCSVVRELDASLAGPPQRPPEAARPPARVELRLGDVMEADVSDATRVLIFATCFPPDVVVALQRKLMLELPAGARVFCAGDRGLWRGRLAEGGREMLRADLARRSCVNASNEPEEEEDDILQKVWRVEDPGLRDDSSHCSCSSSSSSSSSSPSSCRSSPPAAP